MMADAVGGVWVFATSLARALANSGYAVHLVVLGPRPSAQGFEALRGSDGIDVELTELALEWLDPEGDDFPHALDRLAAIERRVRPNLVHLNSFREASGDWSAPLLITAHSCVWSWWRACRGQIPAESRWHKYREHVASGLAATKLWVAPTEALRREIQAIYAPCNPGTVVWNGIDFEQFHPRTKDPVILAAGRLWDEAKNIASLSTASEGLDWPVLIAGPEHGEDGSVRRFDTGRLQMLGPLTRAALLAEMQRAAIFAAPARYEPFGLAVLEAAAAGCALLLADIPSFRELWNGAALFVNPSDTAAIRGALRRLCDDAALRRKLQYAGRERAGRYALQNMVDGYRRLYGSLIGTSTSHARVGGAALAYAGANV
jgi:glycosyltransferase involved in cell wall biosynthesis